MRPFRYLALPFALALPCLAGPASAATRSTPPASNAADTALACFVQNLDTRDHVVTARIFDQLGNQLDEQTATVPGRSSVTLIGFNAGDVQFGAWCEFEGLSRKVRGFLHIHGATLGTVQLLPAGK
jgi:hypothetical protein